MIKTMIAITITAIAVSILVLIAARVWFYFAREVDEDHQERLRAERALREAEEDLERAIKREKNRSKH